MNRTDCGENYKAVVESRRALADRDRAALLILSLWMAVCIALLPTPVYADHSAVALTGILGFSFDNAWSEPEFHPSEGEGEPQTDDSVVLHLPDLRTLLMSDLHIKLLPDKRRTLRLANTIWNSGQGPLELTGKINPATNRTRVHQNIYTEDGDQRQYLVGEFVWHPTHNHWHFDEFTLYELWTLQPDLSLDRVVASSDKLSYCIIDTDVVDREHPRFIPRRGYAGCDQHQQGLSVGWGDTYNSSLDGQSLDLSGIPDGFYALTSTVNPNGIIIEEDYNNNSALVYLAINGDQTRVVTLKQIKMAVCDATLCE